MRVFSVEGRSVTLTKKDSLMKEKVQVYGSMAEVSPGSSITGLVVASTEHGFVIRTFGGLKGLLRHDDVKEYGAKKLKTGDLKVGSSVRAYV